MIPFALVAGGAAGWLAHAWQRRRELRRGDFDLQASICEASVSGRWI